MLKLFIEEIIQSGNVYALKTEENYASVESLFENDDDDTPIEAMCIWSNNALTLKNIQEEWTGYVLDKIALSTFLEDWCVGLFNDGLVYCLNINNESEDPIEYEPLELAYAIAQQLLVKSKEIRFENYKGLEEYILAIEPYIITKPDNDIN